jgi:hypothetical protein
VHEFLAVNKTHVGALCLFRANFSIFAVKIKMCATGHESKANRRMGWLLDAECQFEPILESSITEGKRYMIEETTEL